MSEEEKVELYDIERLKEEYRRLRADEVDEKFIGIVESVYWRVDRFGQDCLFFVVKIPKKGRLTIKYTKTWIDELTRHLEVLGFRSLKELEGCRFEFKRIQSRRGYPRHVPVKRVNSHFTTADKLVGEENE